MGFLGFGRRPDLEARIERLERAQRDLVTDWEACYEKFAKLYARLAKRAKREMEPEEPLPLEDRINQQILAERGELDAIRGR